jgi:hypothetical protein
MGCFFKFHLIVGVGESIVAALYGLQITHQLFKSYVLHEWCVHSQLSNAYYEVKFKKTPDRYYVLQSRLYDWCEIQNIWKNPERSVFEQERTKDRNILKGEAATKCGISESYFTKRV